MAPAAPTLVLVPTEGELRHVDALGGLGAARPELTGLGPVAAAARAAGLLERVRPRRVLLLGIAGTLDAGALAVGEAAAFGRVLLEGVGAGRGAEALSPTALGMPQWAGEPGPVGEDLALAGGGPHALLTVCAASADAAHRDERRTRHPGAVAEDMEAFGVALACHLAGVPLCVVRGISNVVGDRDHRGWQVRPALAAARALALERLAASGWGAAR